MTRTPTVTMGVRVMPPLGAFAFADNGDPGFACGNQGAGPMIGQVVRTSVDFERSPAFQAEIALSGAIDIEECGDEEALTDVRQRMAHVILWGSLAKTLREAIMRRFKTILERIAADGS
jgi:hypothetical protein